MIELYNQDNIEHVLNNPHCFYNYIYCDMIYSNEDFSFVDHWFKQLLPNGIFVVQLDQKLVAEMKLYLDNFGTFVNWCIYINDWGGTGRKGFPKKHDDILIYCNGDDFYWDKTEIEMPKATAGTKFDKKGTGLKTPCDVFYDHASFSTMAKERVKTDDGHNIQWQKPQWLMDRLVRPFTREGDFVADPFAGSGSLGVWCKQNNRNYVGIEKDPEVYKLAKERIENCEIPVQVQQLQIDF
jgi:site-specific DNA-methyltransferase (adenine-specific)